MSEIHKLLILYRINISGPGGRRFKSSLPDQRINYIECIPDLPELRFSGGLPFSLIPVIPAGVFCVVTDLADSSNSARSATRAEDPMLAEVGCLCVDVDHEVLLVISDQNEGRPVKRMRIASIMRG
jgi:hypothetical protein